MDNILHNISAGQEVGRGCVMIEFSEKRGPNKNKISLGTAS